MVDGGHTGFTGSPKWWSTFSPPGPLSSPAELHLDAQTDADEEPGWAHGLGCLAGRDARDGPDLGAFDALETGRADVAIRAISAMMGFCNQSKRTRFGL